MPACRERGALQGLRVGQHTLLQAQHPIFLLIARSTNILPYRLYKATVSGFLPRCTMQK